MDSIITGARLEVSPRRQTGGRKAGGRLVGRARERGLLDGLMESAATGGAAVVITGEAGIGKTALLGYAADLALNRGLRVLRARGEEFEPALAFAALTDLLQPLRERFAELPLAQRQALETCLALSSGPSPSPLAVCAGALRVLAIVAAECPVAVLVDDFHGVDPPSRQALLYIARRLAAERIVLVLAVRDGPDARLDLPVLPISGLSVSECAELAQALDADISGPTLRSLVELTGGNPLAVRENLAAGADATGPLDPGRLTLGAALENVWGRVFEELPEDTRWALFVVAVDGISGGRHVVPALGLLHLPLAALAPVEQRGLVRTTFGEIKLRHPLMRSVVMSRTPIWVRTLVCRALAATARGDLRAWYLAAPLTGPDETAAEALTAAALDAREHTGHGASARTWRRAAELTADPGLRASRLLHAATDAHLAGDSATAASWCQEALGQCQEPVLAAGAELVLGRARTWAGDPLLTFDGLVRAAAEIRPVHPAWAAVLLAESTVPAAMTGRAGLVQRVTHQAEQLWKRAHGPAVGGGASLTALARMAEALARTGEVDRAARYRERAAALLPSAPLEAQQHTAVVLAQGDLWSERFDEGRTCLNAAMDRGRRPAGPLLLSLALGLSGELGWWTGRWDPAHADATEALRWAEELKQVGLIGRAVLPLSRIAAARGDRERCHLHVQRVRTDIEPCGLDYLAAHNAAALGLCALSCADLVTAIDHLECAWEAAQVAGLGNPNVIPFAGDLAEALARAGAAERAEQVLAWLQERAEATGLVYPLAAAARSRGILARDLPEAETWFARAHSAYQRQPMPFEQARTLLCEGEALRRARHPAASRPPLRRALTIFGRLGARPWEARAMGELDAAGVRDWARNGSASVLDSLSSQELQVARAVGCGLNNIEAAAALFLSRKTVEAHLTRAYRKLGIRSRTELTRLLTIHDGSAGQLAEPFTAVRS